MGGRGAEAVKDLQGRREVGKEQGRKMAKLSKSQGTFHSHQKIPEKTPLTKTTVRARCWFITVIPALGEHENHGELKTSLGYIVSTRGAWVKGTFSQINK